MALSDAKQKSERAMPRSYVSDFTSFINEMKSRNPQIEEGQIRGRSILWDKSIDSESMQRFRESGVPQPAYVYFPIPKPKD